ncbi:MAG: Lrp/AsnC family transcriptional regulator [Candidatus Methanogaster sp.]|uniref:Lrp/AsnC family transcriptional regulator n=1 Tax=Candidatus Methanogaster sp. TaxID=3386292 RepID=A0AC61L300_9EURY|nr:MAG: Lrp/AsnC family transcriptional regulator [ANME-2 cluster archaeon]
MEDHRNQGIRCWRKESCEGLLETLSVDNIDMKIIRILSENARMSNVDIANKIGVSEGTVRRRITEMAKNKVIEGFALLLNCEESEKCVKAFISIEIADSSLQSVSDELLKDHEHIIALYRTSTRFNLLCEVMFRSIIELQEFIDGCHKIEGIVDLDVKMVIGSYKKCLWTGV